MELDFLVCCSFRGGRLMTAALLQTGCRPEQSAREATEKHHQRPHAGLTGSRLDAHGHRPEAPEEVRVDAHGASYHLDLQVVPQDLLPQHTQLKVR